VNHSSVDIGIIQQFRAFAAVKLVLAVIPSIIQITNPPAFPPRFATNPILSIIEAVFLLVYLSIPWLREKLKWSYLPIALAVATIAPIASSMITFDPLQAEDIGRARSLAEQWQLIIVLIVPLIFISWKYNLRTVIAYSLTLAVVDVLISLPVPALAYHRPWFEFSPSVFRTAVFLLVGYIVTGLVARQREQNEKLRQAYRQLASYATTTEQLTLSRERNRLARELHDTLAHTLSAVAVQLEAVSSLWSGDRNRAHELLQQSLKLTRSGLSETRRAIQSLRAAPVEEMGLVMAISNLARSFAERYQLVLNLQIPDQIGSWEPETENSFYRIAEEALRNVAQHAGARNLWVTLKESQGELSFSIRDNGRGFDPNQVLSEEARFGLQGMRERAIAIGASFELESEPGKGTTITVRYQKPKA
jgi:signal transduction histidine kinase